MFTMKYVMRARVARYGLNGYTVRETAPIRAHSPNTVRTVFKNSKRRQTVIRSRSR